MPAISPKHLNQWINFTTKIDAPQVREEFLNIYNLVNGQLDSENLADNSITTNKIPAEAVTDDKIKSVSSGKVKGKISLSNLPEGIAMTNGGDITGTFTFNTASPFIKTYQQSVSNVLEAGTGDSKITLLVDPSGDALTLKRGDAILFQVLQDGTFVPKKFKMPEE